MLKLGGSPSSPPADAREMKIMAEILEHVMKNNLEGLKNYLHENSVPIPPSCLNECLKWSCFRGNEPFVEYLLELGADPNHTDEFGTTVLDFAVRGGFQNILNALLTAGALHQNWYSDGEHLLHRACRLGYKEVVKTLLENSVEQDSSEVDSLGHLAIHVAAVHGRDEILEYLLKEKWFHVNCVDQNGWTALQYVCSEAKGNYRDALAVLLNFRADPMLTTPSGKGSLDLAFESGIANALIEILTLKKIFRLLIHADNIVPIFASLNTESSTKTSSGETVKTNEGEVLRRRNTFLHHAMGRDATSRQNAEKKKSPLHSTVIDASETEGQTSQSKLIFSMWKKIFQNDDVNLLSLFRDSNTWQDPQKPLPFEQTQIFKKDQLIHLFYECYENGLGIFSFVEVTFQSYVEQGNFKSVLSELCGIKSCHEPIVVDDFVLYPSLDQSLIFLALMTGRLKLTEMLLRMRQFDILPVALLLIIICRRMTTNHSFPDQVKDTLKEFAIKIESIAVDALSRVFLIDNSANKEVSLNMLHVPYKTYGNLTLIDMADQGQCSQFLSLPCCQAVLDQQWYGKLSHMPRTWRWMIYGFAPLYQLYLTLHHHNTNNTFIAAARKSFAPISAVASYQSKALMSPRRSSTRSIHVEQISMWTNLNQIIHSPSYKFCYHGLSHVIFLALFSYVLLRDLHFSCSWKEYLCIAFVMGYTLEDLRQCILTTMSSCFSVYIGEIRNWLDMSGIFFTVTGFTSHFVLYFGGYLPDVEHSELIATQLEAHHEGFYWCRAFLLIGLLFFYIRFLFIVTISPVLGPRLTMMSNMLLGDLLPLSLIFALFVLAFGTATQALLYPNGYAVKKKHDNMEIVTHMFERAFYSMFAAEQPLDELECKHTNDKDKCPNERGAKIVLFVLHAVFVFSVNISLINLLIGLFSTTVERISAHSTAHWLADRYKMVEEYKQRSLLPPPFNIATCICEFVSFLLRRFRLKKYTVTAVDTMELDSRFHRKAYTRKGQLSPDIDMIVAFIVIQSFALKNHRYQLGERGCGKGAYLMGGFGEFSKKEFKSNHQQNVSGKLLIRLEDKFAELSAKVDTLMSLIEREPVDQPTRQTVSQLIPGGGGDQPPPHSSGSSDSRSQPQLASRSPNKVSFVPQTIPKSGTVSTGVLAKNEALKDCSTTLNYIDSSTDTGVYNYP